MTETQNELYVEGYRQSGGSASITAFLADIDIVDAMRCSKCEDPPQRGGLRHETWRKRGQPDKAFTVCRTCGHRRPF